VCAGDARVHRPEDVPRQQSQIQRQHSCDSSAAASAVAAATTAAAEGSVSSRDVSAESSPAAVTLIQPEQAVGEAQSMTSTGDVGPRVQGPPVDRAPHSISAIQTVLPASNTNSQQQDAAASQPLDLFSASADVVVPQVQGRAVVHSSAAADSNQICLVEDDRQSVADSQAHASAEEVASRVQDATADASPLVHGKATEAHAALATPLAVNAESAPADAASAEAAAAAQMALDAEVAGHLHEEDCKSAGIDSQLQSDEAMVALQAKLLADIEQLHRRAKLHPITPFSQPSPPLSYEEKMDQEQLELGIAVSLSQYACVGKKVPLEPRAGADKDSPHGRLPFFFSHVRPIKGEDNNVAWLCV
jgi:hypothetical protein